MNYYIQGNKEKAEEIKAAFEKLGYNNRGLDFSCGFFYTVERDVHYCISNYCVVNIIKTHPDYKELELHVQPKFKVGDYIIWNGPNGGEPSESVKIIQLIDKDQLYMVDMQNGVGYVAYDMQDYYKLVQKLHYDIANFNPFDKVLVRYYSTDEWKCGLFSHLSTHSGAKFVCIGATYVQCIPFNDDTEHLLGTTDMCDEQYINW